MNSNRLQRLAAISAHALLVFLPALAVVTVATLVGYRAQHRAETAIVEHGEQLLVEFQSTLVTNQLNLVVGDVKHLASQDARITRFATSGFDSSTAGALGNHLLSFLSREIIYQRIRIYDLSGGERLCVDQDTGVTVPAPGATDEAGPGTREDLGDSYVRAALQLPARSIFVSRLDVETASGAGGPGLSPVIRFATPVVDSDGRTAALIVLDYHGDILLDRIRDASNVSVGKTMLLNSAGFWLFSPDSADEWGFLHRDNSRRFSYRYPEVWHRIQDETAGVIHHADGTFIHQTVYPLMDPGTKMELGGWRLAFDANENQGALRWHIVTMVPSAVISEQSAGLRKRLIVVSSVTVAVFLGLSFLFAATRRLRRLAEQEVRRLSTAVSQSATGILITDLDGVIIFANDAAAASSGYSVDELIGRHTRMFNSGVHEADFYREMWDTITAGRVWSGELRNRRKDGSLIWEEVSITPVRGDRGKITSYLAVKDSIQARKEAEERLRLAKDQAEEASRLKSEFLANMSHEIRTPMNAILGFTELLIDEEPSPDKRKRLDIIRRSGKHLLALINDILDFSKIDADKVVVASDAFALRQAIDHLYSLLSESVKEKGLYFNVEISDRVPRVVSGDEHRISQILLNVLGNAVKFTDSGGITLSCDYVDGMAIIRVSDTGIGIDPYKLEKIFTAFEQAETTIERRYGGTGLGLAISRRLARLMNGRLYADSIKGEGATFTLEVPLPEAGVDDVALVEEYVENGSAEPQGRIVEGRRMLERWLAAMGSDRALRDVVLRGVRALPQKIDGLEAALDDGDIETVRFIAHDMKGYTGNLHMTEVYETSRDLYDLVRKDDPPVDRIRPFIDDLKAVTGALPAEVFGDEEGRSVTPGPTALGDDSDETQYKVLVAEDNPANQELVRVLLDGMGLSCDVVSDGAAAVSALERNPGEYAVLLLDMQMPVMSGEQVVHRVRGLRDLDDLYIIAITAHARPEDHRLFIDLGCDDAMGKPIDRDAFVRKISNGLQSFRAARLPR